MDTYKDVFKKLRAREDQKILIINAPKEYTETTKTAFTNVSDSAESEIKFDFIQLFACDKTELNTQLPPLVKKLQQGGLLWVCYPKKSSGINSNLVKNESWDVLKIINFRPVTAISVDATWTALRLKPVADVQPKKKVNTAFINHDKRIVIAPEDLQMALDKAGLSNIFNKMAFTHKREYVEAIEEAKKPETREKRIAKTIELLKQKKNL
ncbi:MAG TPA: YdeI/OmpD-associated family protein [Bacteroidales bacterium]|nr:YdeI/OmpD-associated family protein [Bacteroidales bacterium]HRX96313.1 YdeI/OmpD-associated family protein [Bacteroidales bacterium]